jgi:MFS family permease
LLNVCVSSSTPTTTCFWVEGGAGPPARNRKIVQRIARFTFAIAQVRHHVLPRRVAIARLQHDISWAYACVSGGDYRQGACCEARLEKATVKAIRFDGFGANIRRQSIGATTGRASLGAMCIFSFVAAILLAASSAAPTPLYHLYQQSLHLTPAAVTVVFAIYAFSLIAALLTVGGLSDYIGRKPVILASLVLNVAAMALFATAGGFGHLILARVVQGVSVGAGFTALGAAILDTNRTRGPLLNSVFVFLGLMTGSLGSALLLTFAPSRLHLVYEVLLVLTAALIALLWVMPETTLGKQGAWSSLRPRVSVPRQSRTALLRLTPGNIASWALCAFYLSLMPTVVSIAMGGASPLTGAVVVAALMAAAAMTVAVFKEQPSRRLVLVGTGALSLGVALSLLGIEQQTIGALLAGTVVAGIGFGANFSGTVRSLLPTVHPDQRAGFLSAFYVQSYLAFSLPTIAVGLSVPAIGLSTASYTYGAAVILLALACSESGLMPQMNAAKHKHR